MKYFIFLVVASIEACTSIHNNSLDTLNRILPDRLYALSKKSDAHLVVISNFRPLEECRIRLLIDDKPAADFTKNEVAHFGLTFGTHRLQTLPLEDCIGRRTLGAKINVKAGDALVQRVDETRIESVSPEVFPMELNDFMQNFWF